MEDSCEMHSEDDKGHTEKNKKRKIKTRAQLDALEKFYEEHKYPTESMKSEMAVSLGLTEKQISGWFCHRRLKDKRISRGETYANGRADRSSGVIQDRGSGFRQDSCGSTKQGDDKDFDHREVESRRLTGPEVSPADMTFEVGTQYGAKSDGVEDTPSGSTSSLGDGYFSHNAESVDMATSRYLQCNIPADLKVVKPRTGPSGYLKVKGQVENAAITSVKRQLGKLYQQDGPPLTVEFDPLPPGAFQSSMQNPVNEPVYAGEAAPALKPALSEVYKQPNSFRVCGSISKANAHVSDLDGASFKNSLKSAQPEYYFNQKPHKKSSMHKGDHYYSERKPSVDMLEGSAREMTGDSRSSCKFMAKHEGVEIRTSTSSSNGFRSPYTGKVNGEKAKPRFTSHNEVSLRVVEEENFGCKPSNFILKGSRYHDRSESELSRKVEKDTIYGDGTTADENYSLARMKILRKDEMRICCTSAIQL